MLSQDLAFRVILLLAILSVGTCRAVLLVMKGDHAKRLARRKQSVPSYYLHTGLIITGFIAMIGYIISPSWLSWASFSLPEWLRWCGVIWLIINTIMIFWAHYSLGNLFSINLEIYSEHELIKHGIYSKIRHPMYTFLVLDWFAVILITANWLFLLAAFGSIFRILHQTSMEEAMMAEAFGDEYLEYKQSTGRFFPRLLRKSERHPSIE
jgi:protein-S-isoprenylcysteine O-methyltransferase Ste14